jgi:hypothetical protein
MSGMRDAGQPGALKRQRRDEREQT